MFPYPNYGDCKNLLPHEQFEKFFDDDLLEHIVNESGRYALFLNMPNPQFTVAELRTFIGILIISGCNGTDFRYMWDDVMGTNLVAKTTNQQRMLEILQFLHFEDNAKAGTETNPNPDKMWKLRPLTDHIKANMIKHFHPEQNLCYDESIIDYFGNHGCKHYIKGE